VKCYEHRDDIEKNSIERRIEAVCREAETATQGVSFFGAKIHGDRDPKKLAALRVEVAELMELAPGDDRLIEAAGRLG
jgi:hypothetical protein